MAALGCSPTWLMMGWPGMWRHWVWFWFYTTCFQTYKLINSQVHRLWVISAPLFTCHSFSGRCLHSHGFWRCTTYLCLPSEGTWLCCTPIHFCYMSAFIVTTSSFCIAIFITVSSSARMFFFAGGSNNQVSEVGWAMGEVQATSAHQSRLSCISLLNKSDFSAHCTSEVQF